MSSGGSPVISRSESKKKCVEFLINMEMMLLGRNSFNKQIELLRFEGQLESLKREEHMKEYFYSGDSPNTSLSFEGTASTDHIESYTDGSSISTETVISQADGVEGNVINDLY